MWIARPVGPTVTGRDLDANRAAVDIDVAVDVDIGAACSTPDCRFDTAR